MSNSTVTPTKFDLVRWGNTSSFFIDSLQDFSGESSPGSVDGDGLFRNPAEGPVMLSIGIVGVICNILCLAVLQKQQELRLSSDYLFLLRAQSSFDLLYLITSTPITAFPYVFPDFSKRIELFVLPWIFPFVQITMTASIYNTIAVAAERYLSIRDLHAPAKPFPVRSAVLAVIIFSILFNVTRFFELRQVESQVTDWTTLERVNDTFTVREKTVHNVAPTYTLGYFLGYNMIGSFLISLLIPVATLGTFNTLIWRKLQQIWKNRQRLGVRDKRNTRAALTLVLVVILFFVCHSMKLVVSGYQLVSSLLSQVIMYKWPRWVDVCTFISHFLLATGASVNILLYCSCDKRFFVVVQKTLKTWFVWPITTKGTEEDDDDRGMKVECLQDTELQDDTTNDIMATSV